VVLQIEKDAVAKRRDLPDGFRAGIAEELATDLEHADDIGNLFGEQQGGLQ